MPVPAAGQAICVSDFISLRCGSHKGCRESCPSADLRTGLGAHRESAYGSGGSGVQPWEPTLFKEPAQPSVQALAILAEWKSPVTKALGNCWAAEPSPGSIPEPRRGTLLDLETETLHHAGTPAQGIVG